MSNVIELSPPDNETMHADGSGTPMPTFSVEYSYDGMRFGFNLPAYSIEDAENRLRAIAKGEVLGKVYAKGEIGDYQW